MMSQAQCLATCCANSAAMPVQRRRTGPRWMFEMVKDGALDLDFENEVTKATVITKDGAVVSEAVKKLLEPAPAGGGPA